MLADKLSTRDGRRGLVATAAAVVLAACGLGFIGVAVASQHRDPEPPPPGSGYKAALAAIVEAPEAWFRTALSAVGPSNTASPEVIGPVLGRSKPVTLKIPSIGVHSALQHLGQTGEGALEVPAGDDYNNAAWYRYSPTPGSLGPAVLLGHVDSAAEGPSVFFRLGELRPGDRVSITRADRSIAVFVVDEVRRYAKDDFPTERVYSDIDHAGLRIVTCGGAFDDSAGHYLDNIVVFASLVGSR